MFRRRWSGLPEDATFPSTLEGLGYFVNEADEIRSIENPNAYFKYYLSKNSRVNDRQRFSFNAEVQRIVQERLEKQGLEKILLPLGVPASQPHLPIFASKNLAKKSRVVLIFGEQRQDLGILAHRVCGGGGGIDKGSMVSVVKHLKTTSSSADDSNSPGIVLANMGQLYWWPEGGRPLCPEGQMSAPRRSLVHHNRWQNPKVNSIPHHETHVEAVEYIFNEVAPKLVAPDAALHIVALSDSVDEVEDHLDQNWESWKERVEALVLVGVQLSKDSLKSSSFKDFLRDRGRAYMTSDQEVNTPLAGPDGNPFDEFLPAMGCPLLSGGDPYYNECLFVQSHPFIADWLAEVARNPDYRNPEVVMAPKNEVPDDGRKDPCSDQNWAKVPHAAKPSIVMYNQDKILEMLEETKISSGNIEKSAAPQEDSDGD